MTRDQILAVGLVILGTAQMIGDLSGLQSLSAIAAATGASPAPKVFVQNPVAVFRKPLPGATVDHPPTRFRVSCDAEPRQSPPG